MSHVQIPVKVNRKDILPLAQHVLRTILTRKATEQEKIFVKLDECFSEENTNGINSGLQEYVSLMAEVASGTSIIKNKDLKKLYRIIASKTPPDRDWETFI